MDNMKSDFEKRKEEIDEYFSFLLILNNDNVSIKYTTINGNEEVEMSVNLHRIFIANTFLLLYNLVESTIRNSIMEIYNKIKDDEVSYKYLSEKIKQIWLEKQRKTFTIKEEGEENLQKSIDNKLQNIIENIINTEIIVLTDKDIDISGNIDAKKIRELAKKIGFENTSNGRDLREIKLKRNRLAHGEQTFHDIGKDVTYNTLNSYKDKTFLHLEDVIGKIEQYINNKHYKIPEEL